MYRTLSFVFFTGIGASALDVMRLPPDLYFNVKHSVTVVTLMLLQLVTAYSTIMKQGSSSGKDKSSMATNMSAPDTDIALPTEFMSKSLEKKVKFTIMCVAK
jgi:hypothetical protein